MSQDEEFGIAEPVNLEGRKLDQVHAPTQFLQALARLQFGVNFSECQNGFHYIVSHIALALLISTMAWEVPLC